MKTIRLGMTFLIVVLLSFLFGNGVYAEEKKMIRIGSPLKAGHILVDAAEKFKELVAQGSGGRIEVQIDAGTKSEEEISKLNRTGEIEMQSNGTMFLQDYAPPYFFFTGPYVMKDFEHFMRAWNGRLGQAARAQLEKNDLKYLGTVYRGLRQTTAKKPIYTPADVHGLKLRLPNTWNPSITGTKSEDTILATSTGVEMITRPILYPTLSMEVEGSSFVRPAILERDA